MNNQKIMESKMQVRIIIHYGSIWADKVIETTNGEIFVFRYPTGHLHHETWFDELDEERRKQIKKQVPGLAA